MTGCILVVEDDESLRGTLRTTLRARSLDVAEAEDGTSAIETLQAGGVDLVLLDLGLPDMDGSEVLSSIRSDSSVPVIVLTARDHPNEKVRLLEAGADDYVTKPFDSGELVARVRVALRHHRQMAERSTLIERDEVRIDLTARKITRHGEAVSLTRTEWSLLEALACRPGRLLTHHALLQDVWGPSYATESNYLRTYVAILRKKLGDAAASPRFISTEPGVGYRWVTPEPPPPPGIV